MPRAKQRNFLAFLLEQVALTSPGELFMAWMLVTVGFAVLYFGLSFVPGHGPTVTSQIAAPPLVRLGNSLYFSIVTATSVGYGDIVPQGFSKILVSLQSIFALFIFAVFVTKLTSHRESVALEEVRKFTLEESLHTLCEELFITRKDLDLIMHAAKNREDLLEEQWGDLRSAYKRCQSILQTIPELYGSQEYGTAIDRKREELLLAAVERTFQRIERLLEVLNERSINWTTHEQSFAELHGLIGVTNGLLVLWRDRSPHLELEEITELIGGIREKSMDA